MIYNSCWNSFLPPFSSFLFLISSLSFGFLLYNPAPSPFFLLLSEWKNDTLKVFFVNLLFNLHLFVILPLISSWVSCIVDPPKCCLNECVCFYYFQYWITSKWFLNFVLLRKVTLVMVGLDNAGKTATAKGIQGGKQKIFITKLF